MRKQLLLLLFSFVLLCAQEPVLSLSTPEVSSDSIMETPAGSAFEVGNYFYGKDQYDSAETYYFKALEEEGENSAVLYNLSSAVYRQHRLGEALLLLEKAKLRNPKDEEITHNLQYLYTQTVDEVTPPSQGAFLSFLYGAHSYLPLKKQLLLLSFLGFLFVGVFAIILFKKNLRNQAIYGALFLLLIILVDMSSVGYKVYHRTHDRFGVILAESVEAKNEPKGVTLIFTLHEGTKVQIIKSREGWSFIKLPSGSAGWISQEDLGVIE